VQDFATFAPLLLTAGRRNWCFAVLFMRTRVKICCISSVEEARLAVRAGASALGLVGPMPSGPGVLSNAQIAEIVPTVPPGVATFLLTSETTAAGILAQHRLVNTNTIQIVDHIDTAEYAALRAALPMVKLVQVIHVLDENSVAVALEYAQFADALLLDSGNPNLLVKELGGTGRTHDWSLSRRICVESPKPVWLAGGLNPANAAEAIAQVQPFGLDLCSGVRTNGQLDEEKLTAFFNGLMEGMG
jgi:phosphoribosylanthranilate isomerase